MDVYDAAMRYKSEGRSVIILAGKEYGSGSSRDWAAKGPWILVSVYSDVVSVFTVSNDTGQCLQRCCQCFHCQ